MKRAKTKIERDARKMFELFDADGSGNLDAREMQACTMAMGVKVTKAELAGLMVENDDDGYDVFGSRCRCVSMKRCQAVP